MSEMSNFSEKPKSKIVPSTSIFAQIVDRTSTIDRWGGGGGLIKLHLEVIICLFKPWTKTLRCSNIIQKQAPAARQTPEPAFLNVYGAPELIPRNEFRKPM
jgi:hypothetical protein